jgi:hypothetical protein
MSLHDITVNFKDYTPVFDGEDNSGCDLCAFRNDSEGCRLAVQIVDCSDKEVYFVTSSKVDLRSDTQQMQNWQPAKWPFHPTIPQEDQPVGTKYDQDKLQYSLIPPYALEQVAKNLTVGLKKYKERNNWKKVEGAEQRYLDALYRHLEAHRRGEVYDPDSSVPDMPHLAAVAVNAMFLLEFMLDPELKQKDNK